ncbi:LysR family transcriptional regulator [Xinfangfangia sp. D13-10-4-6]|uniref:LysR family transcriptional regulator n=1 Tax=Pseudogemmobacter hezensis TaxID=2737662 RepID=UPI001556105F|nr:LysR family transcriptional regulator [Pseudogemmobacter hezensis]NPD13961.1 LysR family transcriptional regulator [Pseudogemmobacter hezensis]
MAESEGRITLWGIEVFLAAAEEGAISSAARRLGVSPSAVSQQLTGLEAALGTILLDRGARPVRMTPAGAMFRRHAQTMLNAAQEARAELARSDLAGLTTLRLGMIEDFEADVTPRLLSALAQELPGCRFLLETGPSHRLLEKLEARALDIVVAADLPTDRATADERESHPILREPFLAIHPANGTTNTASNLPLIQYSARHLMGRQIAAHLSSVGLRPAARFELDSYHAILAMVAAGEGWAILPPLALHQAWRFRGEVAVAPLPFEPLARCLSLVARAGVFRDIPALIAARLRILVRDEVQTPALVNWPWLKDQLLVL